MYSRSYILHQQDITKNKTSTTTAPSKIVELFKITKQFVISFMVVNKT